MRSKAGGKLSISRVDLGPCDLIDAAVANWRTTIERGEHDAKEAAIVNRLVWQPIVNTLPADATTIYLSPDGQLSTLPWAALPAQKAGHAYLLVS